MKHQFKVYCLLVLVMGSVCGQKITVLNKSFTVDSKSVLHIDLQNAKVFFEPSLDGKVHVNYDVIFNKYSKRQREKYMSNKEITAHKKGNTVKIAGIGTGSSLQFRFFKIAINTQSRYKKDSVKTRKSKDSILNEMAGGYRVYFNKFFKRPLKERTRNYKGVKTNFVIKVPENINITIVGAGTVYDFKGIKNSVDLNIKRGGVVFDKITNPKTRFHIKDAFFKAKTIEGGEFYLNDVYLGLIGSVENATIKSDFSSLEIAGIGKNVSIIDFNSTFWFYDFAINFTAFNLVSEYSTLNLYGEKSNKKVFNVFKSGVNKIVKPSTRLSLGNDNLKIEMTKGLIYYHK